MQSAIFSVLSRLQPDIFATIWGEICGIHLNSLEKIKILCCDTDFVHWRMFTHKNKHWKWTCIAGRGSFAKSKSIALLPLSAMARWNRPSDNGERSCWFKQQKKWKVLWTVVTLQWHNCVILVKKWVYLMGNNAHFQNAYILFLWSKTVQIILVNMSNSLPNPNPRVLHLKFVMQ